MPTPPPMIRPPLALSLLVTVLASSCVFYGPDDALEQTGVVERRSVLSRDNFRVVASHVEGEAWCPHLFYFRYPLQMQQELGFPAASGIALGDPDLRERAMKDLHSKHDMKGKAEMLHNIHEEWTCTSYLGLYAEVHLNISAEVVEFLEEPPAGSGGE